MGSYFRTTTGKRELWSTFLQVKDRQLHGFGDGNHPAIVACELDRLPVLAQVFERREVQRVKCANRRRKGFQCASQHRRSKFQQCEAPFETSSRFAVGLREVTRVQACPDLVFKQATGDQRLAP